jgi:hypothetical protein
MSHPIYKVVDFEIVGPYTVKVVFDDGSAQVINFLPVLEGELYKPLQDMKLFNQLKIDPETHTLVWPNGADFDPETLHDWPKYSKEMRRLAKQWNLKETIAVEFAILLQSLNLKDKSAFPQPLASGSK